MTFPDNEETSSPTYTSDLADYGVPDDPVRRLDVDGVIDAINDDNPFVSRRVPHFIDAFFECLDTTEAALIAGIPRHSAKKWGRQQFENILVLRVLENTLAARTDIPEQARLRSEYILRKNGPEARARFRSFLERCWPKPKPQPEGYVYFVGAPNGLVKIGKSRNVDSRFSSIRTASPIPLELLHVVPTDRPDDLELAYHTHFRSKRSHGEWFELTPEDLETVKSQPGVPNVEQSHPPRRRLPSG